jgi:hypothetical protein
MLTVVQYCGKPASIGNPIRQYIDNGATNVYRGMPQKTGYADGTASFAKGRGVFTRAATATAYLIDPRRAVGCRAGGGSVIRVDSHIIQPTGLNDPYVENPIQIIQVGQPGQLLNGKRIGDTANQFSFSTLPTGWSIHRRGPTRSYRPLLNGKQNQIMSSAELISRRKNNAIGRGSIMAKDDRLGLSFNANNLNGAHTNFLETTNARRRCRNSGYVVPPKCRVGPVSGPYIHSVAGLPIGIKTVGNCGSGNQHPPNGGGWGGVQGGGWPVTPLLASSEPRILEKRFKLSNSERMGVITVLS